MPVYSYECAYCKHEFDEYHKTHVGSGKTSCVKCGNTAYKIPARFNTHIFQSRKCADGTQTPHFVNTPKQEKEWLKANGITLDPPSRDAKLQARKDRDFKRQTAMSLAFQKANEKFNQGFRLQEPQKQREVKGNAKFERNSR